MNLHAYLACVLNNALVGGDDGGDFVGFDGIEQGVHLVHLLIENHSVYCDIALHAVGMACFGDGMKVVEREIFR